ncbi:unnamed protein product [Arabis nemorensis]|uniref:S-protein homolog n=1 Tax=Arabis nemorensis TaxID=586526 RepID=A0A565BWQ3_9BRAS|nr:unnamed protein product [Arabis nemorensis]
MVFSKKPHCILMMFMILFTLVLFASALGDVSYAEAPAPRPSHSTGFLPLAEKHVVVHNVISIEETLNIHCKSSENDLGLIHIPYGKHWGFRFHVNMSKSTRFRCHLTWFRGGSNYFDIFKVSRDDNPLGKFRVCKECIWDVGRDYEYPMCRTFRDGSGAYCFAWNGTLYDPS